MKREEDSSLLDRLLTFGEETEGAGFSPGVKKPKVNSREEGSWRSETNRRSFDDGLVSFLSSRLLTFGEEAFGCHKR